MELDIQRPHSQKGKMDAEWRTSRADWNPLTLNACVQGWTETHVSSCCLCLGDLDDRGEHTSGSAVREAQGGSEEGRAVAGSAAASHQGGKSAHQQQSV